MFIEDYYTYLLLSLTLLLLVLTVLIGLGQAATIKSSILTSLLPDKQKIYHKLQ